MSLSTQCELSNLVRPTMGNSNIRSEGIFLLFSHCYSKGKEKNIGKKGKLGESGFILTLQTFFSWHLQTNQVIFSLWKSSKAFAAKSNQSIFLLALSQRFTQHYFRQKEKISIKKSCKNLPSHLNGSLKIYSNSSFSENSTVMTQK